jgi:hypothetical protein
LHNDRFLEATVSHYWMIPRRRRKGRFFKHYEDFFCVLDRWRHKRQ